MTELEIMLHAKSYIDKMANGINPLTDERIPEGDLINNVRISRCLFYVSSVMDDAIANCGKRKKAKREALREYTITPEELQQFTFSQHPLAISKIVQRLNDVSDHEDMKPLKLRQVTERLVELGLLQIVEKASGGKTKMPTDEGMLLGIHTEIFHGANGPYTAVVYELDAQHYIIDNMNLILGKPEPTE